MKLLLSLLILIATNNQAQKPGNSISIDFAAEGAEIPRMHGVFFEEIGHAGEGGLYSELLRNRSFEDNTLLATTTYKDGMLVAPHQPNYAAKYYGIKSGYTDFKIKFDTGMLQGWQVRTIGNPNIIIAQTTEAPKYTTAPHNIELTIQQQKTGDKVSLINNGFAGFYYNTSRPYRYSTRHIPQDLPPFGIALNKGESYRLRMIIKASNTYKGHFIASMLNAEGKVIGKSTFSAKQKDNWQEYTCELRPSETVTNGSFSLSFDGSGTVRIDYVSLMPLHTFNNRPNGLRKDIATMIAGLRPAFIRWPGGCIVEGLTLSNRYKWKETLGDPASRPGEFMLWGYRNSYGFGYHEFLQYCEDVGAAAMFVCNVGMSCLYRNGDYCSPDSVQYYIQDALDAIEYAIGDVHTEWGAKRAAAGHPAPFPLKYIEVGNENRFSEYSARYDLFYQAIKAKYPQIILIADHGIDEVKRYSTPGKPMDMTDSHWYDSPHFFFNHYHLFDTLERTPYKIYVGEYSANLNVGAGNMEGALSEAVFAMGMERNSDLVKMCSYAPLLQHAGDTTWPVNMIIFDNDKIYGRSSYYVQQLLSINQPSVNLNTLLREDATEKTSRPEVCALRHYVIGGYDNKTNDMVIKVVNGEATPFHTTIDIKNAGTLATEGTVIVLSANSGKEENSFAEPKKISPITEKLIGVSELFDYEFKPFSFTVLRIKRSKGA